MKLVVAALFLSALSFSTHADAYKALSETTEVIRNMALAAAINLSVYDCESVSHSFIRGVDKTGITYTTARCRNGGDYMLMEGGDFPQGKILTCDQVIAIALQTGVDASCWTPLFDPMTKARSINQN